MVVWYEFVNFGAGKGLVSALGPATVIQNIVKSVVPAVETDVVQPHTLHPSRLRVLGIGIM